MFNWMQQEKLIFKECLRVLQTEIVDVDAGSTPQQALKSVLGVEQLRGHRTAFIEHCNSLQCFYIDSHEQLEVIKICDNKEEQQNRVVIVEERKDQVQAGQ